MKELFSKIFSAFPAAAVLLVCAAFFPAGVEAAPPQVIHPEAPKVIVPAPPKVIVPAPPKVIVPAPPKEIVSNQVRVVGEADFNREISRGVVLVDFYADWCPPCRRQAPIAASAAAKMPRGAKIIKVNVDQAKNVASRYSIQWLPTWVVFKNGREVQRFVGLRPEKFLLDVAGKHLRKR